MARGVIPLTRLQRIYENKDVTSAQIAEALGWVRYGKADVSRVNRTLGLRVYSPSHGRPNRLRQHVDYDTAVRLVRAMGVDPVDIDV